MSTPTPFPTTFRTIYEFSVETTNSDSSKSTTFFAFKRPSRAEREDADSWRAGWYNRYLEKGLIPEALLLKQYDEKGGIYTEAQKDEMKAIRTEMIENEFATQKAQSSQDRPLIAKLANDLHDLRERFARLYRIKESFLQNTAEAKAVQRLTEWLVLFMSYYRADATQPWVPFFPGASEEDKYASLDGMEENELYQKSISNLNAVSELFIASGGSLKAEDLVAASVAVANPVETPATPSATPPPADVASQSNPTP